MSVLEDVARGKGHRFVLLDKLYVSLAWGCGHAACHIIFFFVSFLSLTNGSGTYYLDTCPQMSIFLMAALYSLAFGMLLSAVTVINFEGFHSGNWLHVAIAPAAHFTASLLVSNGETFGSWWGAECLFGDRRLRAPTTKIGFTLQLRLSLTSPQRHW